MLIVTQGELDLADCFSFAAACGVTDLGTWGEQGVPTKRVSGYRDGAPVELIWWSRAHAGSAIDAIFAGDLSATADAIANGIALRTSGLAAQWQERLRHYPDELANARIEDAALTWGGFAAAGSDGGFDGWIARRRCLRRRAVARSDHRNEDDGSCDQPTFDQSCTSPRFTR